MTAYIEVYNEHKSIIKLYDTAGRVIDRYEVDAIHVEMTASAIRPSSELGTIDRSKPPLIVISGARN